MPKAGRAGTATAGVELSPLVTLMEMNLFNRKTEKVYIVTPEGIPLSESTSGSALSVSLSEEDLLNFSGNVAIHNHPGGSSFSPNDLIITARYGAKELRVVGTTKDGIQYRFRVSGMKPQDAAKIGARFVPVLRAKMRINPPPGIRFKRTGRIVVSTSRARSFAHNALHETNIQLAKEFGYFYSRVEVSR